jgi:predicted permease
VVLLIAAGLFIRSLQKAQQIDPGFHAENVLLLSVNLGLNGYNATKGGQFYQQAAEGVESIQGVKSATWSQIVPLGLSDQDASVHIEGYTPPGDTGSVNIDYNIVGLKYFETMGIDLVQGRDFNIQDTPDTQAVMIINERFARRYWPDQDPINKKVSFRGPQGPFVVVVGVVKNSKYLTLGENLKSYIYLPLTQNYSGSMTLQVRTAGDPNGMVGVVKRELQNLDPALPAYDVKTLTEHMSVSLLPAQLGASLLGIVGMLALMLAAIGIYGLTAFSVVQRTREIGIRMALGAQTTDIIRLAMRQGLALTFIGLIIGLIGAFLLSGVLSEFLYGVSQMDPITYVGITIILGAVAILACYLPARRATKVDPMISLRQS